MRRPAPPFVGFSPLCGHTMELFTTLFGNLLAFVYHCFDRIVIHGYLSALSRPEQVVYFFRQVLGVPVVSKEILSQRTADYHSWVEAFARNHHTPIVWAEKGVRKEDHVLAWQRRMAKNNAYGVYFIFKSMEQGPTFRISMPKYPTKDPHYRILAHQRSRFTHYYFYIRDEVLGPMVMRVASFFPFQTTYYLNGHSFIEQELKRAQIGFRKNDNAFLAVDAVAALQAAADRLSPEIIRKRLDYWTLILGPKFSAKERKQLNLSSFYAISQIEYFRKFIFKRNFPTHKLFERSCELGLWRLTANKIAAIFGSRLHRRHRGKLATVMDPIEHGHPVILDLPAQRTLLKQPQRLWSQERLGPSRCRPSHVPSHHRPFRRLPGAMAQCPRRLSSPAADCFAHRHWLGPLSRHQNPRYAGHTPMRGSPPWRHSCRRRGVH